MKLKFKLPAKIYLPLVMGIAGWVLLLVAAIGSAFLFGNNKKLTTQVAQLTVSEKSLDEQYRQTKTEYEEYKNIDQVKRNEELAGEMENIQKTYKSALGVYEDLAELRIVQKDVKTEEKSFAGILSLLSERKYQEAKKETDELSSKIAASLQKSSAAAAPAENAPVSNQAPTGGYSKQTVETSNGKFSVSLIAADYSTTKVIVDTASASDCADNCPTLSLAEMVSRNTAYAGIHGAYYCPADYPSCAGKVNSFDLLIMNKDKYYFNSDNNIYSVNPAVIFGGSFIRFVSAASQWGRDTSVDSVLSNFPLLVNSGQVVYQGSTDAKFNIKSSRGFVANKANTVYIGVVYNANIADSAAVMKSLGMDNAINLDGGGTTALWYQGYKAGPGRGLTNAILFKNR